MRSKRTNDEPPLRDGWCALAPGEKLVWVDDTPVKPSPAQLKAWMNQIRGDVLAAGFIVEEELFTVVLGGAFGTLDPQLGGRELAERAEWLRNPKTGLDRKIAAARPYIREILVAGSANKLMQDLADYRRLRNLMAHRPCWMKGIWDELAGSDPNTPKGRTVGFQLLIADSDFTWIIDESQTQEWSALLERCRVGLESVRNKMALS